MAQEYWYGERDDSDVVVSLVRSSVTFNQKRRTNSLVRGSTATEGEGSRRDSVSRKRKRNTESEQDEQEVTLEDLHLRSIRLRSCSKYFDACLSGRWAKASREDLKRVHVSLDVHTKVKYYVACFSRMYSPLQKIPSVKSALGLLQVASQISYEELVEACVCYLAAVPWSQSDEKRIRKFATSPYYPSDCSADLSARLGLRFSTTERYKRLVKEAQELLHDYFLEGLDANQEGARDGFSKLLRRIVKEQCHGALLQGFLKEVTTQVGEIICQAEAHLANEDPFSVDNRVQFFNGSLDSIWWILVVLLRVGSARELVELIVDQPTLSDQVRCISTESYMRKRWLDAIVTI